jgi:hypothetical protein
MKSIALRLRMLGAATLILLAGRDALRAATDNHVGLKFSETTLTSLSYGETELIENATPLVKDVVLESPNGDTTNVSSQVIQSRFDKTNLIITCDYAWGSLKCAYKSQGTRLNMDITIENRSPKAIAKISFEPIRFKFSQAKAKPKFDLDIRKGHNWGKPTVIGIAYDGGVMVVVNEDVVRPLYVGFPTNDASGYPLMISTAKESGWPTKWMDDPRISRSIPAGGSDQIHLSLRFGPAETPVTELAADIYKRYADTYPFSVNWDDRRPIGALFLSSSHHSIQDGFSNNNVRGWFMDKKSDFSGEAGQATFKTRLMEYADVSVGILTNMNAQGMIAWDIQGQEYPHATSYIGDPRELPPEMAPVIDGFFKKFTDAKLRVGVCVRPQLPVREVYGSVVRQQQVDDQVKLLIDKMAYAKKRWNCTIFYVDSNVTFDSRYKSNDEAGYQLMSAMDFKQLAEAFPDCLIMPEHENTLYYAYSVPYNELKQDYYSTPAEVLRTYPKAFSILYMAEAPVDEKTKLLKNFDTLVAGVKRGDILLFRAWWTEDPCIASTREVYRSIGR